MTRLCYIGSVVTCPGLIVNWPLDQSSALEIEAPVKITHPVGFIGR